MSDVGGGESRYIISVDTSGLASIEGEIAAPIEKGSRRAEKAVDGIDDHVRAVAKGVASAAAKLGQSIGTGVAQGVQKSSPQVQTALIRAVTQQQRAQAQAQQQAARAAQALATQSARQQTVAAQAAGKQQAAIAQGIAQQAVIQTRVAGQQRVAITRAFLDTIGRLERGLGKIVEGTASTIVAATRRVFAGTVGSLQRSFAERRSTITRELRIEQGLFANAAALQQRTSRGLVGFGLGAAGLIGGGALAAGAIRQIFTLGSDFTRGLNVLQAQLQLTDFQMSGVDKLAIKLGNDIQLPGVSALDAAQAVGLLAKQFASAGGFAIAFAEDAAKGTLQLARAVGAPAEEAAQTVGAAVNVFGEQAQNATHVADQLTAALSQAAGTSFTDFSQAFTQGASVVSSFITPADGATNAITEFSAALAVLARGGLVGSDAGTSIKQFFLQANRGSKETVAALAEVSQRAGVAGTAFFDESGKARSLVSTVDILQRGLAGLTEEQRASTLQTIFGSDATRVANILIGQGAAALLTAEAAVQRQGAAAALAAAQNKGLAGAVDAIKSQFETFGIQIFQKVNKPLGEAGLKVADFIDKLATAGGVFAAVRAGLKGVGLAIGSLLAIKGFVEVAGVLRSIVAFLGPLGVTAIVVGGALGFLLKRFGSFSGILDAVGRLIDRVSPQVAKLRETIFDFLSGLAQRAQFLGRFRGFLSQIFDLLGQGKAVQAFDRLKEAAKALIQNLAPIGNAIKQLIIPLRNLLEGRFVEAFRGAQHVFSEIGSRIADTVVAGWEAANPVTRIIGSFVSKFKTQLIGAGVGAVAGGLLGGPLGVAIGAALGVAIANGIGRLREIIGRVDVGALFGKFLNGVQEVGRRIGLILSDEKTILGVAGIAAAAAAIAGRFVVGFISGIVSHAGEIASAFGKILQAAFTAPSIVKSVAALAILIRGALTDQFKNANFADVLQKQISGAVEKSVDTATLGDRLKAGFTLAGKKAGQALSVGLASALSGSALGTASNNLEKGLGIAGIAGSAAAAFTSFGGGPQGAIAAAATAGVGLLTAALTANAKKAAEAKAQMLDYRDALDAAAKSGGDAAAAIEEIFSGKVNKATDTQLLALKAVGVNLKSFQDQVAAGGGQETIDRLKSELSRLLSIQDKFGRGNRQFVSDADLQRAKDLGIAVEFLEGQFVAVNDAAKSKALKDSLLQGASAADLFEQRVSGVSGAAGDLAKKTEDARKEAQKLFQEQRADRLKSELDAVKQRAADIGAKADEANRKLVALLSPKVSQAQTLPQAADTAAIATPGAAASVAEGIAAGVGTALGGAQVRQGVQDFGNQVVAPLFAAAVKDGVAKGDVAGALNQALLNETIAINQLDVPQAAKDELLKSLNEGFKNASDPALVPVGAEANLLDAQKAAADLLAEAQARATEKALQIGAQADIGTASAAGQLIQSTAQGAAKSPVVVPSQASIPSAAVAGTVIHSTAQKNADKPVAVGSTVTPKPGAGSEAGATIARNVFAGFARAAASAKTSVVKAVTTVINGVTSTVNAILQIGSPSKVFMGIGEDTMAGLVIGIRKGGKDVESAVGDVAQAMIDSTRTAANSIPAALNTIFEDTFKNLAIGGGANTQGAVASFTTALRSVISQVSSNAQELFDAAAKDPTQRTLAERLLLGESFTSLRVGDEFGVANRAAIAGAVDAIESIGKALVEQGFSAQAAADKMFAYRQQLLLTAVQAGLATSEVDDLLNSLGLSASGLQQFVSQADRLQQIVAEGQRRQNVPVESLPTGPSPTQQFITNNLYLPTGDPEANALAVVNRLALAVR